jgi:hypothetical protein
MFMGENLPINEYDDENSSVAAHRSSKGQKYGWGAAGDDWGL